MIKINGTDLAGFCVSVKYDSAESQTPEIRTNFSNKGTFGSVNYGATHGNALFTFSCFIQGNVRHNIKEIIKLFLDDTGNYKEVRVDYLGWENRYYMCMLTSPIEINFKSESLAEFELAFTSTFPFGQSTYMTESYFNPINLNSASLTIPINYYGSYQNGFEFSFFGTLANFDIEVHFTDGSKKVFKYTSDLHSTYFVCDFNKFTIDDNGNNGLSNSTGDFLYINKATTKIVFKGNMEGSMTLKYRELYV